MSAVQKVTLTSTTSVPLSTRFAQYAKVKPSTAAVRKQKAKAANDARKDKRQNAIATKRGGVGATQAGKGKKQQQQQQQKKKQGKGANVVAKTPAKKQVAKKKGKKGQQQQQQQQQKAQVKSGSKGKGANKKEQEGQKGQKGKKGKKEAEDALAKAKTPEQLDQMLFEYKAQTREGLDSALEEYMSQPADNADAAADDADKTE